MRLMSPEYVRSTDLASNRHDDLAELFVRFQVAMRFDNLVKRKDFGDFRLKLAGRQSFKDECFCRVQAHRVADDLVDEVAAQRQALAQDREQREGLWLGR